jgi:hypothetical protein
MQVEVKCKKKQSGMCLEKSFASSKQGKR